VVYGSELWVESKSQKNKLQAVEMGYLRRSARKSKLGRVPSKEIRRIMEAEETVLDRIEARKLRWFGHVMSENARREMASHDSLMDPTVKKEEETA
jgi:hypothetical protein